MNNCLMGITTICIVVLLGCSNSPDLEKYTLRDYQKSVSVGGEDNKKAVKTFMTDNKIDSSYVGLLSNCLSEYAYTKNGDILAKTALGWCIKTKDEAPSEFKSYVNLDAFFAMFSSFDGSYAPLESIIKKTLNDPGSYKHERTTYSLTLHSENPAFKPYSQIRTNFFAKNGFNATIRCSILARVDLGTQQMEILETSGI